VNDGYFTGYIIKQLFCIFHATYKYLFKMPVVS